MSLRGQPLSTLAPAPTYSSGVMGGGASNLLLWFVIISLLAWFLLYAFKPTVVQRVGPAGRPTGEADPGKALLGGLLIGLVIVLILWLLRAAR